MSIINSNLYAYTNVYLLADMPFPDDLERSFHSGWLTNVPVSCRVSGKPAEPALSLLGKRQLSREEEDSCNDSVLVPDEEEDLLRPSPSMEQHLSGVTEELEFYSHKDSEKCSIPQGTAKNIKETEENPGIVTVPVTQGDWPNGSIPIGHAETQCVIFLPRTKSHVDKRSRRRKRTVK